jgi:hypothetical protein
MADFDAVVRAIDRANADDPRAPREVEYSRRMADWAARLRPDASPELLLAVRAQHVRRWSLPREGFPAGRAGYLSWREKLKRMHADVLGEAMRSAGWPDASVEKARGLILRKNASPDPEGQTLEDAACLVFLETEFPGFAAKTADDKVVEILRKTWEKMSPSAREAALQLPLGGRERGLVEKALS